MQRVPSPGAWDDGNDLDRERVCIPMTEEKKQKLQAAGVDLKGSLERFMNNEALYERFLGKFAADPNYQKLKEAMAAGDREQAEIAAHTIKGVAGNLGFTRLGALADQIVQRLRAGEGCGALQELFAEFDQSYQEIYSLLQGA